MPTVEAKQSVLRWLMVPVFFALTTFTAPFAQAQFSPASTSLTTEELVRRLDAHERELAVLRQRDRQHTEFQQATLRRLPAVPAAYAPPPVVACETPGESCVCGCCGDPPPICQGVGPLCRFCKESLSWNKGAWRIVPFGFLTCEGIGATASTASRPFILYLNSNIGVNENLFTIHGQTSALGFNFSGPPMGGFQTGGVVLFNFLGDRPVLNQATPFFLRGYGELKNENWRFTFGQQGDLFNPLDPVTVNFGGNKQAGNAGSFRGSFRAEHTMRFGDAVQWTTAAALSQQTINDFVILPVVIGTDNGWPNVEGRVGLGLGAAEGGSRPVEVGLSGVIGQTRAIGLTPVVSDSWGVSADVNLSAGWIGARGEFLVGQALGTYNAAIGQSLNPFTGEAIRTAGGWGDVWIQVLPAMRMHLGYGIDDPRNEDLGVFVDPATLVPFAGQRGRNEVYWANLIWDVREFFDVGFEVAYRETAYIAPSVSNQAMIYHFRTRLKF